MWKRAWKDTWPAIGIHNKGNAIRSIVLVVIALLLVRYLGGQPQMSEELRWIVSSGIAVVVVFFGTFLFNLVRAPVYIKWEKEKAPTIAVRPNSGRRQWDYEHQHLMWAELEITNTSYNLPLPDVEVRVASCLQLIEKQDEQGHYALYDMHNWNSTNVCWSERNAKPAQLSLLIPPGSTRNALIAFCDNSNGNWSIFNAPLIPKPQILNGAKIEIEVSSPDSALWKGEFYIKCHPNYATKDFPYRIEATFEFVEWQTWIDTHNVISLSVLDRGDSQTE